MKGLALIIILAISLSYNSLAQQSSCDYKVEIIVDGEEFRKEDFKWRIRATKIEGKSTNITGIAEIKANGKTVKSYKPWTSASISMQKTSNEYSPNLNPGNYEITAEINVECDDINKDNNLDSTTIKIKGENETNSKKSNDEDAAINNKIDNEEFMSPPQKINKSTANEETENIIKVIDKNTGKNQISPTTHAIQNPETVYVSSNEKAKGLILIFILALSILLNIILIWKR